MSQSYIECIHELADATVEVTEAEENFKAKCDKRLGVEEKLVTMKDDAEMEHTVFIENLNKNGGNSVAQQMAYANAMALFHGLDVLDELTMSKLNDAVEEAA